MTVGVATAGLLAELEERAQGEAEAVLAEAAGEVARIRAAAEARCAEIRDTALAGCAHDLAPGQAAARLAARQAARRVLLEAQHAAVRRVLERVPAVACGLGGACTTPADVVRTRIADVLAYLDGAPAELRCAAPIVALVEAALQAASARDVRVVPDARIAAGVRATTLDGRVVVDDTLDAWLARESTGLAIWICQRTQEAARA